MNGEEGVTARYRGLSLKSVNPHLSPEFSSAPPQKKKTLSFSEETFSKQETGLVKPSTADFCVAAS